MYESILKIFKKLFYAAFLTVVVMSSAVSFFTYVHKTRFKLKFISTELVYIIFCFLFLVVFLIFSKKILIKLSKIAIFFFLPLWGLLLNFSLPKLSCYDVSKGFKSPAILNVFLLYGISLAAYYICRKRKERLRPFAEFLLVGSLTAGCILCFIITIHFLPALFFVPLVLLFAMPLVAPLIIFNFFLIELLKRLKARGKEELYQKTLTKSKSLKLLFSLPLIGVWSILHKLVFSELPHTVFTKTCGWAFSTLKPDCSGSGHYLCTVALKGHSNIVKPERLGVRRGEPIVVNRQLAVANAFEDLLVERVPRTAKLLRKIYDKTGLPISRYIKHPITADIIYLVVKPLEFVFYVFMLLVDKKNPEQRIGAMYTEK